MGTMLTHKGVDIFYGYPVVVFNTAILLALNRLVIHRNHAIFVGLVMIVSLIAAHEFGNIRVLGCGANPRHPGFLDLLFQHVDDIWAIRAALAATFTPAPRWPSAVWGIIDFIARTMHIFHQTNQTRLHSILPEPSFFVYLTLPAVAIYLNAQLRKGGYMAGLSVFAVCYIWRIRRWAILGCC